MIPRIEFRKELTPLVIFALLTGSHVRSWRRTPGRPPFHPSSILTQVSAINGPPASSTITGSHT